MMTQGQRIFAIVRQTDLHPPTRHFQGLPASLHPGGLTPQPEGWPVAIVIEADDDGIFLDRLGRDGSSVGDTWHQSVEDAKHQASVEYAGLLSDWFQAPLELSRAEFVRYTLSNARLRESE